MHKMLPRKLLKKKLAKLSALKGSTMSNYNIKNVLNFLLNEEIQTGFTKIQLYLFYKKPLKKKDLIR